MAAGNSKNAVAPGGGPGGEWAKLVPHVMWLALFVAVVTTLVLYFLVIFWPQCESYACPKLERSARDRAGSALDSPAEPTPDPPTISALAPPSGSICGGKAVAIHGVGFAADTTLRFGGVPALNLQIQDHGTTLLADAPAHWEGAVDVTVATDGKSTQVTKAFNYVCPDRTQGRLLLLVVLAGILGGTLHALRSLFQYAGNRTLKVSWLPMYYLLPFSGAAISTVFFLVFVAGFFSPQSGDGQNFFLMVGVSTLVGMFSQQAVEKLKKISEAVLTSVPASSDTFDEEPAVSPSLDALEPKLGPVAGGQDVKLTGSGFVEGIKVFFDGIEAAPVQLVSDTELSATAPAHAAGVVDVRIVNSDGTSAALPQSFEYQ